MTRAGKTATLLAMLLTMVASLLTVATAVAPVPAQASACTSKRDLTVVVDFTHFQHGKVRVRCDRTLPKTGLGALSYAGFSYSFVRRHPGFICTIGHLPKKCNGAPTSAYWSYWHARPHGKWRYSSLGAASYHPKRGWVEGWAFGKGKPPKISPP